MLPPKARLTLRGNYKSTKRTGSTATQPSYFHYFSTTLCSVSGAVGPFGHSHQVPHLPDGTGSIFRCAGYRLLSIKADMPIRILSLGLALVGTCCASFRVNQILQVPLLRAQAVSSVAADRNGNLIVTGTNVDGGFVSKFDPNGNVVFTFANFGAFPSGAVPDNNGDIYWFGAGGGLATPFPFTKSILNVAQPDSNSPGFLVKFHGGDGSIAWAVQIGGMQPTALALDTKGLPVLAGVATTAPGLTTPGAYQSASAGTVVPLSIVRLSATGDVIFAAAFGGHSINGTSSCVSSFLERCLSDPGTGASSVLLDPRGNIWVAGSTNEIDLPITSNAIKKACGCSLSSGDAYLAEFSSDGSSLLYATYLGTSTSGPADTSGADTVLAAAIDSSAHIWLAGATNGMDLPVTANALQRNLAGDSDGFVLEYDPATNSLVYGTYYGTQNDNEITQILIRPDGIPILAGYLNYDRFGPYSTGNDFVAALAPSGIEAVAFPRHGAAAGLAFTPSGSVVVAGSGSVLTIMDEAPTTVPNVIAIANNASQDGSGQVSPGEITTIVGTNLGPTNPVNAQLAAGQQEIGTTLGGVRVLFDGVAAPLLYVSSTRITAIVPFGTAGQQQTVLTVENGGLTSNPAHVGIVSAVPAIFNSPAVYQHLPVAAAINQDGTINSENNRAEPGSVVTVFATGFGALRPQTLDGSIPSGTSPVLEQEVLVFGPDGLDKILYAGPAPGEVAGVMQINFRLPQVLTSTPTMLLFVGGWSAPYFTVWVNGA